jgi:hypothetical protein
MAEGDAADIDLTVPAARRAFVARGRRDDRPHRDGLRLSTHR